MNGPEAMPSASESERRSGFGRARRGRCMPISTGPQPTPVCTYTYNHEQALSTHSPHDTRMGLTTRLSRNRNPRPTASARAAATVHTRSPPSSRRSRRRAPCTSPMWRWEPAIEGTGTLSARASWPRLPGSDLGSAPARKASHPIAFSFVLSLPRPTAPRPLPCSLLRYLLHIRPTGYEPTCSTRA